MEFRLADIGEGTREAEILRWMVAEGDSVQEDQALVEVQTDKVTAVLPSPWRGRVVRRLVQEGEVVTVGAALLEIATGDSRGADGAPVPDPVRPAASVPVTPGATPSAAGAVPSAVGAAPSAAGTAPPASGAAPSAAGAAPSAAGAAPSAAGRRVLAAPATRKRALELGIDLADVPATGPAGRVTPQDLDAYVATAASARGDGAAGSQAADAAAMIGRSPEPAAAAGASVRPTPQPAGPDEERQPLRGLRRVIARNMATAHREIPQAAHLDDCDVTDLAALRSRWNASLAAAGQEHLSYLPFAVKAACVALRLHPGVAARFDAERQEIVRCRRLHIGIATDAPDGLLVPVVHDADRLPLRALATEIRRLAQAARTRGLQQSDLEGGAFTITNHGAIGGLFGMPIIRHPEVAILGLGRIRDEVVVRAGEMAVRTVLHFSVAFDHRVLDGADIARFAQDFRGLMEDPDRLLLELN